MHPQTVNQFIETNKTNFFPNDKYEYSEITNRLLSASDSMDLHLRNMKVHSPQTTFLLAIFVGSIGIDRFYLGDIVGGILKYFTFGGLGIWWIIDIISAKKRCCAKNCESLIKMLDGQAPANVPDVDKMVDTAKTWAPVVKTAVKGAKDIRDTFYVN